MKRKKGILLSAVVETMVLAVLVLLFIKGIISINFFLVLAIIVGFLFSAAVLIIIKYTEP